MENAGTAYTAAITVNNVVVTLPADLLPDGTPDDEFDGAISGFEAFGIDANNILECGTTDCADRTSQDLGSGFWVKFTEDGSNESTFTNAPDDDPSLKTTSNAQRGLSFSVSYDDSTTAGIGYSSTNIVIDVGAEWNSGQEIAITLTDSDANTNSLTDDDFSILNSDHTIPAIKIGDPFTLGSIPTTGAVTLDHTVDNVATKTPITYDIRQVSDILVLTSSEGYAGTATLTIELGEWSEVNDFLPANEPAFIGTHMLNYDISTVEGSAITLLVGTTPYTLVRGSDSGTSVLTGPDFDVDTHPLGALYDDDGSIIESDDTASLRITLADDGEINADDVIVIDLFSFGLEDLTDNVNDAIYRLELEEDGSNSSDFVGTLEYIGLNQINILDEDTYGGIATSGDSIILISDDSSISVEYRDLDATGGMATFTAEADTLTHSGSISLDSDGYKVSDTVTVTVEDADLNVDSGKADVYTTVDSDAETDDDPPIPLATRDSVGSDSLFIGNLTYANDNAFGELLTVSINGEQWTDTCGLGTGLDASQFTLRETGSDSGVFAGTFTVPPEYCDNNGNAATVTGTDISAEYIDFRDDSGSLISVSASAGIRSSTGSVSLDRTVYPSPFSADSFETSNGDFLGEGTLTVYVSINDSDFNESSNGIDDIPADRLTVQVLRGGADPFVVELDETEISETAPDSGVFELEQAISYSMGPVSDNKCTERDTACILQGDILHVEYNDPSDASGSPNTVTDSATFDLRNGVLQSDQTAYIIGSDMIVTLIEQDLNLDSGSVETHPLSLIEWDSDAGTAPLSDETVFDVTPSNLLETGEDTGIFQVVVGIPVDINEDRLERGEEITLTYIDHGPSGADHVGDKDEEISTTVYTSNFGATIELDQRVYTWTDKVYVTVVAPDHNIDSDQVDEIGNTDDYPIRVSTRGNEIDQYKLVETGADTGIFTGEIILTGMDHIDADGDGNDGDASGHTDGTGPTDGMIGTESESGISVSFKYSDGETVSSSALIRWNVGEVQWLEASYPASGSGIVRVIDPDMNLNPEAVDNFDVIVWSDSDGGGIDLTVTETNAATGIFEGTVFFGVGVDTSGHRLRVLEGDTVTAQYYDNTLPAPFKETERVRVGATTLIGTIVPPLERAPISDLRAVDSFGNTLDTISVDSQIQLAADVTNNQDKAQEFAYLIQIQDENGVTVSLDWIAGSLTEGQSLSPASSWTPTEAGTYEVTAFVWESIENPTALSPTATIAITVN